jgi:hypothetical protein
VTNKLGLYLFSWSLGLLDCSSGGLNLLCSVWMEGGAESTRANSFFGLLGSKGEEQSHSNQGIYLLDVGRARSSKSIEHDRTGALPSSLLPHTPLSLSSSGESPSCSSLHGSSSYAASGLSPSALLLVACVAPLGLHTPSLRRSSLLHSHAPLWPRPCPWSARLRIQPGRAPRLCATRSTERSLSLRFFCIHSIPCCAGSIWSPVVPSPFDPLRWQFLFVSCFFPPSHRSGNVVLVLLD